MLVWMAYATLVGVLVAIGAAASDRVARIGRLPSRWLWAAAMGMAIGLSLRAPTLIGPPIVPPFDSPSRDAAVATVSGRYQWTREIGAGLERGIGWLDVTRVARAVGASRIARVDDGIVVGGWICLSAALGLVFVGVHARFGHSRRRWPQASIDGQTVRIAPHVGPAAIGLVRPEVVVPQWLFARSDADRRMAIAHEAEHIRARDPQVLGAACVALILFPWNPALWYLVARLRLAIELDCDRRVLRRGARPAAYGSLLVAVAEFAKPFRPSALALADDSSHLHTRILAMGTRRHRFARTQVAAAALLGGLALLAACEAKTPTASDIDGLTGASAESAAHKLGLLQPIDTAVAYKVDGVSVTAAEARTVPAEYIAQMSISKEGGQPTVLITTKAAVTPLRRPPPSDRGLADDVGSLAVDAHGGSPKERAKWPTDTAIVWFLNGARADASIIQTLDRAQIENVDVVKGPAAEQEFGVSAGKAVVSIRTKR